MSMETKVIKPLLRSLFISYALSALFLGALAFALYKLRLGESLVNLLIFAVYFAACFAGGFFTGRKGKSATAVSGATCIYYNLGLSGFERLYPISGTQRAQTICGRRYPGGRRDTKNVHLCEASGTGGIAG